MGKRFFYIPMIGLLLLCIFAYTCFVYLIDDVLKKEALSQLEMSLDNAVLAIQKDNPATDIGNLDKYLDAAFVDSDNRRVTVINDQGMVVGDTSLTHAEILKAPNHLNRPEIQQALTTGIGENTRYSSTKKEQSIYIAKTLIFENFHGYIRMALPLTSVLKVAKQIEIILGATLATILILMFILGQTLNRKMTLIVRANKAKLQQHVQDRTNEIELLQRLASMLAACDSIKEAQQVVQDIVPRILGDLNGAVSLMRSSRNLLEIKLDWGGEWPGAKTFTPAECWGLRKGKYHLANDKYTTLPCAHMSNVGNEQTLCIPLTAHGNTIGLMHLYMHNEKVTEKLQHLAFTIGEHLGLALSNLNLQAKLREQAIRDPLTGLYNRRYLEETIDHEFMRCKRHNQSLSLLMLDVDHFKLFNDNFGHDAGDYVLKALATLLTDTVRGEDLVCRIGGEELAIVLPDTGKQASIKIANKLCTLVREFHMEFHGQSLGKLTISIGISTYPNDAEDYENLMKKSDIALYQAKDSGRDKCIHCESISAELADIVMESDLSK